MPPTCDGLVALTVTPGNTPPVESLIVPVRTVVWTACAKSGAAAPPHTHMSASAGTTRFHVMPGLLSDIAFFIPKMIGVRERFRLRAKVYNPFSCRFTGNIGKWETTFV